jgi:hypothetical protein
MAGLGFTFDSPETGTFLLGLLVWELIWKGFALWRAGRRNQPAWFFLIFILNTAGILSIVYLFMTREKKQQIQKAVVKKKK